MGKVVDLANGIYFYWNFIVSTSYCLVNFTRKEIINFLHVNASSARELAGNEASSAITTWYMLKHLNDRIAFVSDTHCEWPFEHGNQKDLVNYKEITADVIDHLINEGILTDNGMLYVDEDEPETIFIRDLRNAWGHGAKPKKL